MTLSAQLNRSRVPPVPARWMTIDALARREGYPHGRGYFYYVVKESVAAGLLEQKPFKIALPKGVRSVMHYAYTRKARRAA
jgi:hypothetical protein